MDPSDQSLFTPPAEPEPALVSPLSNRTSRPLLRFALLMPPVLAVLCLADLLWASAPATWLAAVGAVGLGAGLGLVMGLLLDLVHLALSRLPRFAALLWPVVGLGVGALVAEDLNAFDKLFTQDHKLAVYTLILSGAAGLGLGLLAAVFQARRDGGYAWPLHWRWPWRVAAGASLLAAAVAASYFDRTVYVGLYDIVHEALRWMAAYLATCAVVLSLGAAWRISTRLTYALVAGAVGLSVVPFFVLTDSSSRALALMDSRPYPSLMLATARELTDLDRDGYSSWLGGGDCAPFNRRISPARGEVPGNGKDDNCWGGDLLVLPTYDPSVEKLPMPKEPSPMSVVLITLDSTRADRLGAYGYERPITPNIDELARQGVVFENTFSAGTWTSVAVPSILRGVFPRRMQWTPFLETNRFNMLKVPFTKEQLGKDKPHLYFMLPSDEPRKPLAWWLAKRGLHTMAVVDDGYSQMLSSRVGTRTGFKTFQITAANDSTRKGDAATAKLAIDALNRAVRAHKEPFFFWVHFFGPHGGSYKPPADRLRYAKLDGNYYDDRLANTDEQVGLLLDAIHAAAAEHPIAIVLSADHGEGLHGKKTWHGADLSDDLLRIPLIVVAPGLAPGRVTPTVGSVDIMPTILALTGCPIPSGLDGFDLVPSAQGKPFGGQRILLADNWRMSSSGVVRSDQTAAFDGELKVTLNRRSQVETVESQIDPKKSEDELELEENTARLRTALRNYVETGPDLESRVDR